VLFGSEESNPTTASAGGPVIKIVFCSLHWYLLFRVAWLQNQVFFQGFSEIVKAEMSMKPLVVFTTAAVDLAAGLVSETKI
jgi:hypothetical protein